MAKVNYLSNSGDGANIESDNMQGKNLESFICLLITFKKEQEFKVNDKLGNVKTDIFNKNVSITGGYIFLKIITHFDGSKVILMDTIYNGLSTSKLHLKKM